MNFINSQVFALKLVKPDIKEYYYIADEQITIPKDSHDSYDSILNEKGFEKLHEVQVLVENKEFKKFFVLYRLEMDNSGIWMADENSPFYDASVKMCLNSWNNRVVYGYTQEMIDQLPPNQKPFDRDVKAMRTSPVVFYTDDWCYTQSGTLYGLGKKN